MGEDEVCFDFEDTLTNDIEDEVKQAPANILNTTSVPLNQSVGSFKRNFRQTVCTYWLKGNCALGDACGFLHEFVSERMPVCKTLIRYGVCKEPDCPFKHTLDDIKECNMFKLGFCIYGPQCRFRHTRLSGPPPDPKTVEAAIPREFRNRAEKVTRFEPRGRGGRGREGRGGANNYERRQKRTNYGERYEGFQQSGHNLINPPGLFPGMMPSVPMNMQYPMWRNAPNGMYQQYPYR